MAANKIKKILIIRLSALGDAIHTLPMANAIRKQYPDAQIDWIVEDKAAEFIINNPLLNNVYVLERKKWRKNPDKTANIKEFFSIIKNIRKEKYDIVIDTQQLLKSSLIMGLSGGKRKIALDGGRELSFIFADEIIKTGRKQFDINYHVVKRNLEIAKYLGCKSLETEFIIPDFSKKYTKEIVRRIDNLDKNKKTIVLAPATTWTNKHWTIEGWQNLINEFKEEYNIILTASEKEKPLIKEIIQNTEHKNIIDLSGQTGLSDLVYIYKNADIVISPDSGSAHIAWAVNKPEIITLFFATSAKRTAPYGEKYYSISANISCSPCMKKRCKLNSNPNKCTRSITSEQIINIVKKVLQ